MKLHKFINIQLFVFLCFCFVSNLSFAQFNQLSDYNFTDPIGIDDLPFEPLPDVSISGSNLIDTNANGETTYTISSYNFSTGGFDVVQMNRGDWTVGGNGSITSATNNTVVIRWNEIPISETTRTEIISFRGTTSSGVTVTLNNKVTIYTSRLIGEVNIVIPNNRIQTYTIDHEYSLSYVTNNNSWQVEQGEIISYGDDSVTVKWNTAGVGNITCSTPTGLGMASYFMQVNITSTLTGNETMFTYDTSGNQTSAQLD